MNYLYLLIFFLLQLNSLALVLGQDIRFDMLHIRDSLYFGQYEISNQDWHSFLEAIAKEQGMASQTYHEALPDTFICIKNGPFHYSEPLMTNYFSHPAFDTHPVNGVSYEQVEKFISWLNKELQEGIKDSSYWAYYRLPTQAEWMEVALRSLSSEEISLKRKKKRNESELYLFDCKVFLARNSIKERGFEIYNMKTGVSEMLKEKGLAIGGNCCMEEKQQNLYSILLYEGVQCWLGFRLVLICREK